jgi:galactoside O-acetyltransferase
MITGIDVRISDKVEITRPDFVIIGNHVAIDTGVYISTQANIGDYVHIAPYVCIIGGATAMFIMENFTGIAAGSKVVVVGDDYTKGMLNPTVPLKYRYLKGMLVVMKRFSCIGINSVVLPNVEMAEGSVLGANSLLTKSTEPWTIYVGSPAKAVKMRDKALILQAYKELGYE